MSADLQRFSIGELTVNHDSRRIPVKEADRRPGQYPYYGASGIVDWVDQYIFDGDFLLVAEDGENLRSRNTPVAFMASGRFWVNNHAHIVQGNERADTRFLSYLLEGSDISGYLTGSTIPKLSQANLNAIEVEVPGIDVQKKISRLLGTLDDKIELNRKTNQTLEGIAKALFRSWFVDFDPVRAKAEGRQTGLPNEISELFPDSFEESEWGEIPKGWIQTSIGREANVLTGFPFKSALFANSPPGVRLARGMNVKEGFFMWDSQSRFWTGEMEEFEKYFLDVGDILIGMDGSKVGKNWVRVRGSDLPCLLVQRVARLRHEHSIGQTFLRFLVGSIEFATYVDLVKTGTSIPHISLKQIKEYSFSRPEKSDDRLFAAYEELSLPMMRKVDNNCAQSIVLGSLRDSLLPRLISGELTVPDAEKMLEEVGI